MEAGDPSASAPFLSRPSLSQPQMDPEMPSDPPTSSQILQGLVGGLTAALHQRDTIARVPVSDDDRAALDEILENNVRTTLEALLRELRAQGYPTESRVATLDEERAAREDRDGLYDRMANRVNQSLRRFQLLLKSGEAILKRPARRLP